MNKNKENNITNSIVLMGPSGVGKSLIASTLSQKMQLPLLDIDDLAFFIEAEASQHLSQDKQKQQEFIERETKALKTIKRDTPLTKEEEKKEEQLVCDFVNLYNHYYNLLGGLSQFYPEYFDYRKSMNHALTMHAQIYALNKFSFQILDKVFETATTPFIISPPASFGWHTQNPMHFKLQFLQNKVDNILDSTQNVLLLPGEDFSLRNPSDATSVNSKLFLKHPEYYYKHADLEITTNALFYEPENDFLKQRTWLNVRETITKDNLKNNAEINNICDQIIDFSQASMQSLENCATSPQTTQISIENNNITQ